MVPYLDFCIMTPLCELWGAHYRQDVTVSWRPLFPWEGLASSNCWVFLGWGPGAPAATALRAASVMWLSDFFHLGFRGNLPGAVHAWEFSERGEDRKLTEERGPRDWPSQQDSLWPHTPGKATAPDCLIQWARKLEVPGIAESPVDISKVRLSQYAIFRLRTEAFVWGKGSIRLENISHLCASWSCQ